MEVELFTVIYDFLQTLTPAGFENTNKLVTYGFVIAAFIWIMKLIFSVFPTVKR